MEVDKYLTTGAIYYVRDMVSSVSFDKGGRHQYLILATRDEGLIGNRQGYVQCMTITSMRNSAVLWEVPIIGNDGTIGYIVPYNIFSISSSEFVAQGFVGYISNSRWGTVEDFFRLLMDLYCTSRKLGNYDEEATLKKLNEYNEWFFDTYPDAEFHKDVCPARVRKEELYQRPEVTDELLERVVDMGKKYKAIEDEMDDSEDDAPRSSAVIYTKYRKSGEQSIEDIIREDEEIAKDAEEDDEKIFKEALEEYGGEEVSYIDLYEREEDAHPETVYTDMGPNDVNVIQIPSNVRDSIINGDSESSISYKMPVAKISAWSDKDLEEFMTLFSQVSVKDLSAHLSLSVSNLYHKRVLAKAEIAKRRNG